MGSGPISPVTRYLDSALSADEPAAEAQQIRIERNPSSCHFSGELTFACGHTARADPREVLGSLLHHRRDRAKSHYQIK